MTTISKSAGNPAAAHSISMRHVIYGQPKQVFEAFTEPALVLQWCEGPGHVMPRAGGEFSYFDGWVKGVVRAYEPPHRLVITWKPSEWGKKTPPSEVTLLFRHHAAGTELTVEHSGFPDADEAEKHRSGWIDHVFEPLNDYFTR